jgi:hypothetical protein
LDIEDLDGTITLLTDSFDTPISVKGRSARGRLLAIGLMRPHRPFPFFTNDGGAQAVVLNSRQRVERPSLLGSATEPISDIGETNAAFLREMLARTRATPLPLPLAGTPAGATDLALYRVLVDNGPKDVIVTGKARERTDGGRH